MELYGENASWTVRRGGMDHLARQLYGGTIVATGSGACPDWNGVDDVVVQVSLTPYYVSIDRWDDYYGWWDNTEFSNIEMSTHGQLERLSY